MKTIRFPLLVLFLGLSLLTCKKDNLENGPFAIQPEDFLSDKKYEKLIVEIAYVPGFQPTPEAENAVLSFLNARLHKKGGITIVHNDVPVQNKAVYTVDDLRDIEKQHRDHHSKRKTLTVFVFFADQPYAENQGDAKALGLAYGNTSIAVFEKTVMERSGGFGEPERSILETTVIEHEFGHLFGLVDQGTKMVNWHKDAADGKHCNDEKCLMYYATETSDVVGSLFGAAGVPELDAHCIEDLRANGGK